LILCTTTAVIAQSTDATVSGLVLDPSGRVIPDADIEILNESTGVLYSSKTNESGIYTLSILPPGQYRLQVSKNGFKSLIKPGIVLNVQSAVALNFTLPVGAASESITVEASSTLINTIDASVSTVVDQQFVANTPLNGRSFQDLISMTPGIVTQSPQSSSGLGYNGDFSVNGQRTESNYYMVDGISANASAGSGSGNAQAGNSGSLATSTALGTTQSLISVDALREFRVQSSTYSAEYGHTPGGQFAFLTRSGTNQFRGTAFDYLRNNYFDANDWFNDFYRVPTPALRQNDFGGTFGGPVRIPRLYDGRSRTFFFSSYEGLRLAQPQAATVQYVPDTALRQEAPIALQSILNAYPLENGREALVACSPATTSNYPCPTGAPAGTLVQSGLAQFIKSYSLPSAINSTSIRIDHTLAPKLALFFRFGDTPSSQDTRVLSAVTQSQANTQSYTLGATGQFSAVVSNDFRLGYTYSNSAQHATLDAFGGATPTNLASDLGIGGYQNPYPQFYFYVSGAGPASLALNDGANKNYQWNAIDNTTVAFRHHQLKLGADYRWIRSTTDYATPYLFTEFLSSNSILADSSPYLSIYQYLAATPIFTETALFAQDEWRVTRSVGVSLGLRWELDPPPTEAHGNDAYTLLGNINAPAALSLAPRGTPLWKTTYYNFAPRLGVAWLARDKAGRETVLRTGVGVFFDTDNQLAASGFGGLGFSAYRTFSGVSAAATSSQLEFPVATTPPYAGEAYLFPSHLQLPYTFQWNVSIQQALGRNQAMTLSYVGANGRRLIQAQSFSVRAENPDFNLVAYIPNGLSSNYQALQLQFQNSIGQGIHVLASYTWSHSIDFGSTDSSIPLQRGSSDFDVRNNAQAGVSWDIPSFKTSSPWKALTERWALDGRAMVRSGFPITLDGNFIADATTGYRYYSGVNLVAGEPLYLYGSQYPGGRMLNGGPTAANPAFTLPTGTNAGNAPRNIARGFGAGQINVAARREFHLYDRLALQFRAEAFNALNHPNFGYVDPTLTDATFGQATMMLNHSLGTVSPQYQQGGPRSMQFALKLLF
jgi:Carboxypeptidase regulatory-like domain/TonB-dependent Receptor Plug Domain